MKVTERQLQILEALARYKYLTSEQLRRIWGNKNIGYVNFTVRGLSETRKALVKSIGFGVIPIHGKLSKVHFLTSHGVKFLTEECGIPADEIKYPKGRNSFFSRDYFHRVQTIDFNIAFQTWLDEQGFDLKFFNYYFDKTGANNRKEEEPLQSLNSIPLKDFNIIPDGIGLFETPERPYLFIFEQHNGKDKQRAIKQMGNHVACLTNGIVSDMYGLKTAPRIFYVFEHESCKRAVITELQNKKLYEDFGKFFFFKSMEELKQNFYGNWFCLSGKRANFI